MINRNPFNEWTVYLVTHDKWCPFNILIKKLNGIINAGVDIVQYRDKELNDKVYLDKLIKLKTKIKMISKKVLLLANDRVAEAKLADVDGVHLGQSDLSPDRARKILGSTKIIGLSVHNRKEAYKSFSEPVNYISIGPVFSTKTKLTASPKLSSGFIKWILRESPLPVIGIGGISIRNITDSMLNGMSGVAVSEGILSSRDMYNDIKALKTRTRI